MATTREFISSIAAGAGHLQVLAAAHTDAEIDDFADYDEMVKLDESVWSALRYARECCDENAD